MTSQLLPEGYLYRTLVTKHKCQVVLPALLLILCVRPVLLLTGAPNLFVGDSLWRCALDEGGLVSTDVRPGQINSLGFDSKQ